MKNVLQRPKSDQFTTRYEDLNKLIYETLRKKTIDRGIEEYKKYKEIK